MRMSLKISCTGSKFFIFRVFCVRVFVFPVVLKVIVKGSYVCAYVGERVSEDDLVEQEEEKMRTMKKKSSFVTYAFEIHEGSETFNVDSE